MNLAFAKDGSLYLVERSRVVRLTDRNGDGKADDTREILKLETEQVYPHNGLGGLVFGPDGFLYVGLGENKGAPFRLRGKDGSSVSGQGEGGAIFRCRPDGTSVRRVATGFWNPFSMTFFAGTHLLSIDNDPEVRPPDRLLDVIDGADFGFQYRYGAAAEHPFQSWKGELPGTLSMVDAIGEGATSILSGSTARLPPEYGNAVLVTSWSDRRIEIHKLSPRGASLQGAMSVLVQGGEAFRPVAMAVAPDGSIYVTDWVRRRYEIHGQGRIWKLSMQNPEGGRPTPPAPTLQRRALERLLSDKPPVSDTAILTALRDTDPHRRAAAVTVLSRPPRQKLALSFLEHPDAMVRLGATLAVRRGGTQAGIAKLPALLGDPSEDVRITALIWPPKTTPCPHRRRTLFIPP